MRARVAAGLVLFVIAACSSSTPHATSTARPSPTHSAAQALTPARAAAVATTIGLRASDMRGFAVDANPWKNKVDPTATALARCLGVLAPNQALADVRSDYFSLRIGSRFLSVSSEVLVRPTIDAVTRDVAALRKPTASACFERYLGGEIEQSLPHAVVRDVHATLTGLPVAGGSGYQLSATMTVVFAGRSVPAYAKVRAIAVQHVEVSLDMFGFNAPVPTSYENTLSELLVSRALAHRI